MKGITIGPAGGHGLSRMQGTKVMLAGRTAFLPNDSDTRDRYSVTHLRR